MTGIYNPMKYEISQYSISTIKGSDGRFNRLREDDYIFVIRPGQNSAKKDSIQRKYRKNWRKHLKRRKQ